MTIDDRDHRIVYFHGNTEPFLTHPRGEPTRRPPGPGPRERSAGAVRTAVLQAAPGGGERPRPKSSLDGWIELDREPGRQARVAHRRVAATVAGLVADGDKPNRPGSYFVVSFQERDEPSPASQSSRRPATAATAATAVSKDESDELRLLRAELQGTIEELQTSNEELKAAHEEVMSINEEIQSANEELDDQPRGDAVAQ